jgi:uncharacterized membrane protein YfcA
MSQKRAAFDGSRVSGLRLSASASAGGADTPVVCPAMSSRFVRLAAIGTVAGAFSGLFGVGGGTVIVPLLVLWFGYEEHEATGTSLAAIVLIALLAAAVHGLYGNADLAKGVLIGLPAIAGVLAGTALQQRISARVVAGIFSVLLVVSAALLVL